MLATGYNIKSQLCLHYSYVTTVVSISKIYVLFIESHKLPVEGEVAVHCEKT